MILSRPRLEIIREINRLEVAMKKITKDELKTPDAFIKTSDSAFKYVEHHKKTIFTSVGVLVALGALYAIYDTYSASREEKAQVAVFAAEKKYNDTKAQYDRFEAKAKNPNTPTDTDEGAVKKASGVLEMDYGDVVKSYDEAIKEFSSSKSAVYASIQLAKIYSDYKHFDKAIEVLNASKSTLGEKNLLHSLLLIQLGTAQELKGDCNQAIENWKKVTAISAHTYLHADAYIKIGTCYVTLKQPDKAKESFEKVIKEFADTNAAKSAQKYMRLMKSAS